MSHSERLDALLIDILDLPQGTVASDLSADTCEAWDSANHLRIVLAVEEAFAMRFTVADIERTTSRAALLARLEHGVNG